MAESIQLLWIKWLKSLFREAENDSYYRMLLSLLFSKRMHVVRPKCIWKTRWKFLSFVIRSSIDSFLTWKAVAVITCLKVFFSFSWPLHSKQRKNFLISLALGNLLLLETLVKKTLLFFKQNQHCCWVDKKAKFVMEELCSSFWKTIVIAIKFKYWVVFMQSHEHFRFVSFDNEDRCRYVALPF